MEFPYRTDEEFGRAFNSIITSGGKNNTYKFALARFLLDYCNKPNSKSRVRYKSIAEEFLRYYWLQECKSHLRQGPKNQKPEIIKIIRKEFKKETYRETFGEMRKKEPGRMTKCVKAITKKCFDDVIPRFQNIGGRETKIFFSYMAIEYKDSANNKRIDPGGGILLNEKAMDFMRRNYSMLLNNVILGWARFLESKNFGTPYLIKKIEGHDEGPRDQSKFLKCLMAFTAECFYCGKELEPGRKTQVDHVIPYDYITDTQLWNLVLACQKCNCDKSSQLPPPNCIDRLLERNQMHKNNKEMKSSVFNLTYGDTDVCWHYKNAKMFGYPVWRKFDSKVGSRHCDVQ